MPGRKEYDNEKFQINFPKHRRGHGWLSRLSSIDWAHDRSPGRIIPGILQPRKPRMGSFQCAGCAFAVVGGYVAARLAPARPMAHAIVLGLLMAVFAVITGYAVSVTPPSPEYANQPGWYYPVLAITVLPSILLGAWLSVRNKNKPSLVHQNT